MLATSPPRSAAATVSAWLAHPAAKPVIFVLCLMPLTWLVWAAFTNGLGANPAEALIRSLGYWTLLALCATLAVTPLRTWLNVPALARYRRLLGLFTFFYGALHFLAYSFFDMGWVWQDIVNDVAKRRFILVGTAAWLLMVPLALTSFNRAIKAMGAARWQWLHRLVYLTALLGLLHFFWMRAGKNNFAEVTVYAVILAVLLGWRVVRRWRRPPASRPVGATRRPDLQTRPNPLR